MKLIELTDLIVLNTASGLRVARSPDLGNAYAAAPGLHHVAFYRERTVERGRLLEDEPLGGGPALDSTFRTVHAEFVRWAFTFEPRVGLVEVVNVLIWVEEGAIEQFGDHADHLIISAAAMKDPDLSRAMLEGRRIG